MVRAAACLALALTLASCSWLPTRIETVTVKVPVQVARVPPKELQDCTLRLRAPKFIPAASAPASSCLTPEGERDLTALVDRILTCEAGWRAWANQPTATP